MWMERHQGDAQGQPISDFSAFSIGGSYPAPFEPFFDSGESNWDLYRRAGEALANLVTRFPARILVVSHGAIMNAALRCAIGLGPAVGHSRPTSFRFSNTGLSELEYSITEGIWWIRYHNRLPHLEENIGAEPK
jgi:2,3-bisphosphoglycerate-dependent phosphoglycerate mutase